MPIPSFGGLPPYPQFDDVVKKINQLANELRNLLLNLDTLNVVSLNAEVIEAGTITADKIAADAITADKINVSQLSAIAADLGTITAGLLQAVSIISSAITGSLIQTDTSGNYPRIELSSSTRILSAESASNVSVSIRANGGPGSIPVLTYINGSSGTLQFQDSSAGHGLLTTGPLTIQGTAGVSINTGVSTDIQKLKVDNGSTFNTIPQSDSAAAVLGDLVTDFNTLLGNLRSLNILA